MDENEVLSKGFAFYANYWKAIEHLPLQQQKEVCYAIVKYGITGEMVDPAEMPLGYTVTQSVKQSIDNSVERWEANVFKATEKQVAKTSRDVLIAEFADQGMRISEIARELGVSESTIKRSEGWKNRKQKTGQTGQNDLKIDKEKQVKNRSNRSKKSSSADPGEPSANLEGTANGSIMGQKDQKTVQKNGAKKGQNDLNDLKNDLIFEF